MSCHIRTWNTSNLDTSGDCHNIKRFVTEKSINAQGYLECPWRAGPACSCSSSCGVRGLRGALLGGGAGAVVAEAVGVASGGRSEVVGGGGDADTADPSLSSHHLLALVLQLYDNAMRTNYISYF